MELKFDAIAPAFLVEDVKRAAEYYRDRFGFSLTEYFGEPPAFTIVRRDAVRIALRRAEEEGGGSNRARKTENFDAYIWVSDIDALYRQFVANQAPVSGPPELQEYGIREIWIRDLDGYIVTFGQFVNPSI
jgi:catechol 2,3-dioxygenase-like lactoylglutathione lyase family enzyme